MNKRLASKLLAMTTVAVMAASFTVTTASAKKLQRGYKSHHSQHYGSHDYNRGYGSYGMMRGPGAFRGNAAMSGNHGNSAYGNNSLGHIQGGNIGGGK